MYNLGLTERLRVDWVECWDIKKVGTTKRQGCEETHQSHMIHSLPAQDNSVDLLICANLSTYKLSQINEEILRMLKPSGCVAITAYQVGDRPSVRKKEKPVKMVVKTYLPKQVMEKRIYLPPGNFLSFYFDVRSVIPCSNCPLLPEETSRKDYWAMNTSRIYKFSSLIYTIDSNFCHVEEDESPSQTSDASIKPQRYPICKNNIASIDTFVFLVSPKYSRTLL
ncbi:unnamed protein product [Clavelina lepadiformis]|uniref:Methyltransferase type 11 domain-containing protein n=1 Tax=Clavelina lepadiformis TaxID=159417 RepID=A0ABP0GLF2_CLALP